MTESFVGDITHKKVWNSKVGEELPCKIERENGNKKKIDTYRQCCRGIPAPTLCTSEDIGCRSLSNNDKKPLL